MSDSKFGPGDEDVASSSSSSLPLQANGSEILSVSRFPPLSVFDKSVEYPALIVPVRRTAELRKSLSSVLLHIPKTKNVYPNPDDESTRKLVLKDSKALEDDRVQALLSAPAKDNKDKNQQQQCTRSSHTITFSYADLTVDEVLRKILPPSIPELPSAFEVVGSIAHLNLRDEVLPYKYIVGKVLLDKNQPRIQTVVNKLGSISNEYRTFGMEVIAGRGGSADNNGNTDNGNNLWSLVTVKEERCEFTLDFQQVYWNSRLAGEHKRLVQMIQGDARARPDKSVVVADLMAGVGPFAVPLTARIHDNKQKNKKKQKQKQAKSTAGVATADKDGNNGKEPRIVVHANDLNPASYKYLKINTQNNKCPEDRLHCYNMDARAFCHQLQQSQSSLSSRQSTNDHDMDSDANNNNESISPNKKSIEFHHVIMNLPASAPEFLDAFRGFTNTILPRIHVYCFAPKKPGDSGGGDGGDAEINQTVVERCSKALGCPIDETKHEVSVRIVRDVSPRKNMVCVSFILPEEARGLPRVDTGATRRKENDVEAGEPDTKRAKTTQD